MKFTIIDEFVVRDKNTGEIIHGLHIKKHEIPDAVLEEIRNKLKEFEHETEN